MCVQQTSEAQSLCIGIPKCLDIYCVHSWFGPLYLQLTHTSYYLVQTARHHSARNQQSETFVIAIKFLTMATFT